MILYSNDENKLESLIHKYLTKKYKRIGRLEIFKHKQQDDTLVDDLFQFIQKPKIMKYITKIKECIKL